MAPGLFCIWSRADPKTTTTVKSKNLFSDEFTELPGVSFGKHISRSKDQVMDFPYIHDIPFMSIYDLPDTEYGNDQAFKELVKARENQGEELPCKPRLFEEVFRGEAEGCENIHPRIGDNISLVTCEEPPPEQAEEFWKWTKEVYVPTLLEGPTFLRMRILKEQGGAGERTMPSTPYLWFLEWEDDELPWMDMTSAAQLKEWAKYIEGGLVWQGVCYNIDMYSKQFETSLDPESKDKIGEEEGVKADDIQSREADE